MKIVALMLANRFVSTRQMATTIGISTTAVESNILKLNTVGIIRRVGPPKGGYWGVLL